MSVTSEMLVLEKLYENAERNSFLRHIIVNVELANMYVLRKDYERLPSDTIIEILFGKNAKYEMHRSYKEGFFDEWEKDNECDLFQLYKKEILEVLKNKLGKKIHPNNKCCKSIEWQKEALTKVAVVYLVLLLTELKKE